MTNPRKTVYLPMTVRYVLVRPMPLKKPTAWPESPLHYPDFRTVQRKSLITLPKQFRDSLGIKEGDQVAVTLEDNSIVIRTIKEMSKEIRRKASTTMELEEGNGQ